ncbi:MAG: four-helix bundle copper-binding protein [Gemmataceae bacterium]
MTCTRSLALTCALLIAAITQADQHKHDSEFEKCARACNDCQRICDACSAHCANMVAEGKKEHLATLRTCQDCATFCTAAATTVARKGPFSDLICKACAEACNGCGKSCEKFGEDKLMKECAEDCFRCEKICREMLNHTARETKLEK